MTNWIGRRLDRLETEVQKKIDPGYGPVFELIDDHRDPEAAKADPLAASTKALTAMLEMRRFGIGAPTLGQTVFGPTIMAIGGGVQFSARQKQAIPQISGLCCFVATRRSITGFESLIGPAALVGLTVVGAVVLR